MYRIYLCVQSQWEMDVGALSVVVEGINKLKTRYFGRGPHGCDL